MENRKAGALWMNVFVVCLEAVLPIFLIMMCGYFVRCRGLISDSDVQRMNAISFRIFHPALLFISVYSSDLEKAVNIRLIAFSVISVFIVIALTIVFTLKTEKDPRKQGVMIQGLFRSNFAFVGMPITAALMKGEDVSCVVVLMAIIIPIYNVASVICLEMFNGRRVDKLKVFRDVVKNPLIIGTLLGIVFVSFGIRLPGPLETAVDDLGKIAGPLVLFLLGAFFKFDDLGKYKKELIIVCLGRLIIIPGVFLTAAHFLGFRGAEFASLIGLFASCTAIASFTMAEQMGGDSQLAGDIVVSTSFLCSFTIYMWSVIFKSLGTM